MIDQITIGASPLRSYPIGFGTMHFGVTINEAEAHRLLTHFTELGGNLIDTANIYSKGNTSGAFHERGHSEQIIGQWLKTSKRRDKVILATKVLQDMGDGFAGLSRKAISHQIDQSLLRLKTDSIDLYQIHGFDENTPIEETIIALDETVKSGKVRYIGCSNLHYDQMHQFYTAAKSLNANTFISYQNPYNLLLKYKLNNSVGKFFLSKEESEVLGVTQLAYRTLVNGFLAGKFEKNKKYEMTTEGLKAVARHCFNESGWALLDLLKKIGTKYEATPMQITLAFYRRELTPIVSLIGFSKMHQLDEAMKSTHPPISVDDWNEIDRASKVFSL